MSDRFRNLVLVFALSLGMWAVIIQTSLSLYYTMADLFGAGQVAGGSASLQDVATNIPPQDQPRDAVATDD